jgi:hypothetical protein
MRRPLSSLAVLGLVALVAGCGGSADGSGVPETTHPVVARFEAEGIDCPEESPTGTVLVEWETANATAVEIVVDDGDPALADASGTLTLAVPCDGKEHSVTITPLGEDSRGDPEKRAVRP